MAKNEIRGIVTSFRRGKQVQHTYDTIVEISEGPDPAKLVGAKAVWTREGGFRLMGRVIGRHGRGRAVRVRWKKGFPPEGLGTPATIVPK